MFDPALFLGNSNLNSFIYLKKDYRVTLVDRIWLMKKLLMQIMSTISILIKVKGISISRHKSEKFVLTLFYFSELNGENPEIYICIKCELYLVHGFKANILIDNNILYIESFLINLINTSTQIQSYSIDIIISAKYYFWFLKYKVLTNIIIFILPKSKVLVLFKQIPLPNLRNVLFHLFLQPKLLYMPILSII